MWEDQTADLITDLKKKLLNDKEEVKYRKIVEAKELPQFVKALFKNKVKYFYRKESPLDFKSTPHFKLNSDDIKEYRDKLVNIFWEGAIFSEKEVEKILQEALVLRMNYLIKPIDTIRRMLFEDRDNISLENMDQILNSFKSILPYAEIIMQECSRQGKSLVDKNIFSNIAAEQLQKIFQEDVISKVLKDYSILSDFLTEIKSEKIDTVEGKVLQDFLADRNLWGFRRALEIEMKIDGEVFTAKDLEMILKRYMELKNEFENPKEGDTRKDEAVLDDDMETSVETEKSEDLDSFIDQDQEETPEEESTSESLDWELEEPLDEKEKPEREEPEKKKSKMKKKTKHMRIIRRDEDSEKVKTEEDQSEESQPEGNLDLGLKDLIDSKMEKGFIKKLFDNNTKAYEGVIEKLNKADSWREAKVLIDNELFKRDVDPFSREAIKLVDLVYGIFYPEEGVGGK